MLTTSCSSIKPLEVLNLEVKREPLNLDAPDIADFEDLEWFIITSENAEEMFAKLKNKNVDPVLFGLTDDGYEALSKNFAQIRHYIQKQKLQLETYKKYYEPGVKSNLENKSKAKINFMKICEHLRKSKRIRHGRSCLVEACAFGID